MKLESSATGNLGITTALGNTRPINDECPSPHRRAKTDRSRKRYPPKDVSRTTSSKNR